MTLFVSCWHYEADASQPAGCRWVENATSVNMDLVTDIEVARAQTGDTYECWAAVSTVSPAGVRSIRLVSGAPDQDTCLAFVSSILKSAAVPHWPPLDEAVDATVKRGPQLRVADPPGQN